MVFHTKLLSPKFVKRGQTPSSATNNCVQQAMGPCLTIRYLLRKIPQ